MEKKLHSSIDGFGNIVFNNNVVFNDIVFNGEMDAEAESVDEYSKKRRTIFTKCACLLLYVHSGLRNTISAA